MFACGDPVICVLVRNPCSRGTIGACSCVRVAGVYLCLRVLYLTKLPVFILSLFLG